MGTLTANNGSCVNTWGVTDCFQQLQYSKMKLVAALALCAGASAVNVENLFKEISGKVFKQNKDGFKVSLEPYFTLNCKHKTSHNAGTVKFLKASCAGASGAGGETNPFTRKVIYNTNKGFFSYMGTDEGNSGNWVGSQYYMPEGFANSDFWVNEQVKVTFGDIWKSRMDYTRKGGIAKWGGNDKSMPAIMVKNTVQLKEGGLVDGEYATKVKITGLTKIPKDLPSSLNPMSMRSMKWQMTVDVNADQACSVGPQEPGCTMRGSVRGKAGGNKLFTRLTLRTTAALFTRLFLSDPRRLARSLLKLVSSSPSTGGPLVSQTNWSSNCPTLLSTSPSARPSLTLSWPQLLHSEPTVRLLSPTSTLLPMPWSGLTGESTK